MFKFLCIFFFSLSLSLSLSFLSFFLSISLLVLFCDFMSRCDVWCFPLNFRPKCSFVCQKCLHAINVISWFWRHPPKTLQHSRKNLRQIVWRQIPLVRNTPMAWCYCYVLFYRFLFKWEWTFYFNFCKSLVTLLLDTLHLWNDNSFINFRRKILRKENHSFSML